MVIGPHFYCIHCWLAGYGVVFNAEDQILMHLKKCKPTPTVLPEQRWFRNGIRCTANEFPVAIELTREIEFINEMKRRTRKGQVDFSTIPKQELVDWFKKKERKNAKRGREWVCRHCTENGKQLKMWKLQSSVATHWAQCEYNSRREGATSSRFLYQTKETKRQVSQILLFC